MKNTFLSQMRPLLLPTGLKHYSRLLAALADFVL